MRVLVFGGNGQVGRELARASWPAGCATVLLDRAGCDLQDADSVERTVLRLRPDVVVNAAAYTAVDRAEGEPELALIVNRDAPAAMASACDRAGASLIHLSTDYVFDGLKIAAYVEDDPIAPLSVYGRTKAEGEVAVRERLRRHLIIRTSWVFAAHGTNFVRTILRLARERSELQIVCDQRGAPTAARDIARSVASIVGSLMQGRAEWGTFHFSSGEATTWHDFALAIVDFSGKPIQVVPITTEKYRTAARRPPNSLLDCGRIDRHYGIRQPSWRLALSNVIAEIENGAADKGSNCA